jgi:hypothetical protein
MTIVETRPRPRLLSSPTVMTGSNGATQLWRQVCQVAEPSAAAGPGAGHSPDASAARSRSDSATSDLSQGCTGRANGTIWQGQPIVEDVSRGPSSSWRRSSPREAIRLPPVPENLGTDPQVARDFDDWLGGLPTTVTASRNSRSYLSRVSLAWRLVLDRAKTDRDAHPRSPLSGEGCELVAGGDPQFAVDRAELCLDCSDRGEAFDRRFLVGQSGCNIEDDFLLGRR